MSPAERARKWYQDNRERAVKSRAAWALANPGKVSAIKANWVKNNVEKRRKAAREYNRRNRGRLIRLAREKYQSDPATRLLSVQRVRLRRALRGQMKAGRTQQLLGCSPQQLREHLEKQFGPGMTWSNYGVFWQVDHIKPCAAFDFSSSEQQRACFHFSNLQPLTVLENIQKGASYLQSR